jgi:predicted outer membrane repeat protein
VAWVNTGSVRASYNVVDVDFGINNTQCGWYKISGDGNVLATNPPVWPVNFELLYKSSAANILPNSLPKDYPTADFYGDAIIGGGAAGAVQSKTADGYYYLELSVNDSNKGTVTPNPQPDPDGFYSAGTPVVITATPSGSYVFGYWLINGAPDPSANPLQISSLTANTSVEAVFVRPVTVDTFTDGPGAATTPGTLRYALTNAGDNDVITFDGVTPGTTTIELESALPNITKSLVIEGAGVTLTPADSWTSRLSSLLFIDGETPTVTIRRVHFKNGACERIGGAIYSEGSLTLESCIFSGNHATGSSATGGAITGTHTLIIRGCTFYANMSDCYAGAVFFAERGNVLTLTGNLFYGNDAVQAFPIVRLDRQASIVPSYNVVDMDFGPGDRFEHYECGWDAGTGDTNLSTLGITGVPFDPTNFVPISDPGLDSVLPSGLTDFPATDFYGTTRTFPGAPGAVAEEPSP